MRDRLSEELRLMNTPVRRSLALASALVVAAGLAACSGDDSTPLPAETGTPAPTSTVAVDPALAGLAGPGCAAYVAENPKGKSSIAAMGNAGLATAVAENPLLTQLNAAITGKLNKNANLVDTLNGGEYTVFAPVDSAFAKLSTTAMAKLKSNGQHTVKTVTYHVVAGRLSPEKVIGKQKSVQGGDLKVTGTATALKVDGANVICGGIKTASAVVYLIDTVLTPPK
jgi:uncharacterized surface protein with fasciclin (FAS1) repeats